VTNDPDDAVSKIVANVSEDDAKENLQKLVVQKKHFTSTSLLTVNLYFCMR